jgi:hypothetical protein
MALPAGAARRVSVAELEQLLAAVHGQQDNKVAHKIDGLELTERVSYARLTKWKAEFPEQLIQEALIKISDGSAFEGAAAEDVPDTPMPDREEQNQMLMKAMNYTVDTLHRLPNFTATRRTTSFGTGPQVVHAEHYEAKPDKQSEQVNTAGVDSGDNNFGKFHAIGNWSVPVTYRDGAEVIDDGQEQSGRASRGLSSIGEFGPILNVVLSDASQGKLTWSHWERGENGDYCVFRYTVPEEHSHYGVDQGFLGRAMRTYPGYHGEIGIDPATGSILRISMDADFPMPQPRSGANPMLMVFREQLEGRIASIEVEYGAVKIGGNSYLCPVHSITLSRTHAMENLSHYSDRSAFNMITRLNDVVFTDYHIFRSESRILPVASTGGDGGAPKDANQVQGPAIAPTTTPEQK